MFIMLDKKCFLFLQYKYCENVMYKHEKYIV